MALCALACMPGCGDASADDEDEEDGDDGEWIGAVVGQCRTGLWRYGWASVATCGIVAARVAARCGCSVDHVDSSTLY